MVGCGALRRNLLRKISALAAAGLVALVALWSPVAFAQTAAQTLADLFDGVSIPGLDNLPVGIIEAGDTYPMSTRQPCPQEHSAPWSILLAEDSGHNFFPGGQWV